MKSMYQSTQAAISQLTSLKKKLNQIEGKHNYTLKELFNDDFMKAHTEHPNISSFLEDSGLDFSSQETFRNVDESALDSYVASHSDFSSWHDMKLSAYEEIVSKQLSS